MKLRFSGIFVSGMFCAAAGLICVPTEAATEQRLHIYLPREVTVEGDTVNLGQAGVVRGPSEQAELARDIGLGGFSAAGQQIIVDRQTILSRLASNGINAGSVIITGAQAVTAKRREQIISAERFVKTAEEFIRSQQAFKSVASLEPAGVINDWILSEQGDVKLVPSLKATRSARPRVWVAVVKDGVEIGGREVVFTLRYEHHRAVTLVDIAEGEKLGPDNVQIESYLSDTPEELGWSEPYGLIAKKTIRKGAIITEAVAGQPVGPILIKRKQQVLLKIDAAGLLITAMGESLDEGRVGEYVRIKRGDGRESQIVVGQVKQDGTVEPVL